MLVCEYGTVRVVVEVFAKGIVVVRLQDFKDSTRLERARQVLQDLR